jgi:hypothetical protein
MATITELLQRRFQEARIAIAELALQEAIAHNAWLGAVGEAEAARIFEQYDEPPPQAFDLELLSRRAVNMRAE